MKKTALVLAICLLLCTVFAVSASAAYVTDGDKLYIAGDATADGEIDVCDMVKAAGGGNIPAADLDGDGAVGAYDCAIIRAMIIGIDNSQWTE